VSKSIATFFTQLGGVLGTVGAGWYPSGAAQGMAPFRSVGSEAGQTVSPGTALQLSTVWACVRLIAETIASLPIKLYQFDADGKRVALTSGSIWRMLTYSPNALMTAVEFWEMIVTSLCLWGNAYALKQRVGGRVVSLDPLRPEYMTVVRRNGVLSYVYTPAGAVGLSTIEYTADDILHIKGFGVDGLVGLSPIAMARQTLGRAIATDQASGKVFTSGLTASGFIKYEKAFVTPEQREAVRATIERFTGSSNIGKTMVLENGMEYVPITMNPSDAQMLESREFNVEEICRWFGVPPQLIGHINKASSWASSLENTTLGFVKFALRPYLTRIEQAVMRSLGMAPSSGQIKFNLEALLRGDSAARAALYASSGQNGWQTRDEIREHEDMEPMGGNAGVLTVQSNLVPLDKLEEMGGKQPVPEPSK
jgi:HK97 family phage portal protein